MIDRLVPLALLTAALAQSPAPANTKVGWTQNLGDRVPLQELFNDETGAARRLQDSFTGKPVILVFAYSECPNMCTLVLDGLTSALQKIDARPGRDYELVTVSIDPKETPARARAKKRSTLARTNRGFQNDARGWHFLTGNKEAIDRLADAAGFRFAFDAMSGQFAHPSGIVVLSPTGVISQYLMGVRFEPRELGQAIARAARGQAGRLVEQLLLLCFHYDPSSTQIGARVLLVLRVVGALGALALLAGLARAFVKESRA